jgi:hypothetical protein
MIAASSIGLNSHSPVKLARQRPFFEPAGSPKLARSTDCDDFPGPAHLFFGDDGNSFSFAANLPEWVAIELSRI